MKKLNELIDCEYDILIKEVEEDSRIKTNQSLFCCIEGLNSDGHQYAKAAVANGAVAVIARKKVHVSVPVIKVRNTTKAMNNILSNFYDQVDQKLTLIGVTGTDGKTTLSSIIYQLINRFDEGGLIGTNGINCTHFKKDYEFTTPFPKALYSFLNDFYQVGCKYVTMEASSERLMTDRLNELAFKIAIFTNISPDHLNTHQTIDNYVNAKTKLFNLIKDDGYAIINVDDKYSDRFIKAATGKVITYGINNQADIMAKNIKVTEKLLFFTLHAPYGEHQVVSPLSGKFNVYNLMAAITACHLLGFKVEEVIEYVASLEKIEAREVYVDLGQPFKVMIDYAHTANAISNLLEYLKVFVKGRIIIVIGSGGLRDIGRRIDIGKVVSRASDYVIFTAEDPRTEDPLKIINDMLLEVDHDFNNYEIIIDRESAIKGAINIAKENDLVLIVGKGSEDYMEIGKEYVPYITDKEAAIKYLKEIVKIK